MRKISKCFTIDEEWFEALKKDAKKRTRESGIEISRSSVLNSILKKHYLENGMKNGGKE